MYKAFRKICTCHRVHVFWVFFFSFLEERDTIFKFGFFFRKNPVYLSVSKEMFTEVLKVFLFHFGTFHLISLTSYRINLYKITTENIEKSIFTIMSFSHTCYLKYCISICVFIILTYFFLSKDTLYFIISLIK